MPPTRNQIRALKADMMHHGYDINEMRGALRSVRKGISAHEERTKALLGTPKFQEPPKVKEEEEIPDLVHMKSKHPVENVAPTPQTDMAGYPIDPKAETMSPSGFKPKTQHASVNPDDSNFMSDDYKIQNNIVSKKTAPIHFKDKSNRTVW